MKEIERRQIRCEGNKMFHQDESVNGIKIVSDIERNPYRSHYEDVEDRKFTIELEIYESEIKDMYEDKMSKFETNMIEKVEFLMAEEEKKSYGLAVRQVNADEH